MVAWPIVALVVGCVLWLAVPNAFAGAATVGLVLVVVGVVGLMIPHFRR